MSMSQGRGSSENSNSKGRSTGGRGSQKGPGRGGRGRGRGGRGRGGRGRGRGGRSQNKNNRSGRNHQENDNRQNVSVASRSYTIEPKESTERMDTSKNVSNQDEALMGAYQYCPREECDERQELKQVHELEATLETCSLPQAQRKLDPCLAVSKFKRSAAGTSHTVKPAQVLERTLSHLQRICARHQASPEHPPINNLLDWAEFLVDRLRAIQADATRLSSSNAGVSRDWHVQLVRMLIWIRYWTYSLDGDSSWLQRTINTMIGTAMESYWGQGQGLEGLSDADEKLHERMDDEMLCWSALLHVSQQQERQVGKRIGQADDLSCNSILLDFSKLSTTRKIAHHSLWSQVLILSSHLVRYEYYAAWKKMDNITAGLASQPMSILFKCCIEPNLSLWRYRTIQHYNKSFAKEEQITSVPRLLSIDPTEWNLDHARDFGLPVEQKDDGEIALVFKKAPLKDDAPRTNNAGSRVRDHRFTFGKCFDLNEKMSISSVHIDQMLKGGLP
ncbi:unnamed protein product [Cylindrotheca closterium]|uniref:SAC3/GANP/THP3 conserved domain-containing protein n=1 Tax=Cylindrotheca closterium TaxID=2856 RepID=A0AAD2JLL5_9STRA|nr:unnamed protein product [Cylindrotheca closterium]